LANGIAERQQF